MRVTEILPSDEKSFEEEALEIKPSKDTIELTKIYDKEDTNPNERRPEPGFASKNNSLLDFNF